MSKLVWSKASLPNNDPARVVDVGDYGILSDKLAGRKSGYIRRKKVKVPKRESHDPEARAFPEAVDGRVSTAQKRISNQSTVISSPDTTWSPEDVQILKLLWNGAIPAKRIGKLLGKSRNAVAGKAKRLKLAKLPWSSA